MIPYRKAMIVSAGLTLTGVLGLMATPERTTTSVTKVERVAEQPEVTDVHAFYVGTFKWDDSSTVQQAALDVYEVREKELRGRDVIEVTGRGTYTHSREANFSFEINIDKATGMLTMTESNPDVAVGFITEGRHQGRVSDDGKHISARWMDDFGGEGTLSLYASRTSAR